jgi:hypothetical protein
MLATDHLFAVVISERFAVGHSGKGIVFVKCSASGREENFAAMMVEEKFLVRIES